MISCLVQYRVNYCVVLFYRAFRGCWLCFFVRGWFAGRLCCDEAIRYGEALNRPNAFYCKDFVRLRVGVNALLMR